MLDNLISTGKSFKDKFTEEYSFGAEFGINESSSSEYLQWLAKVGVYSEGKLNLKYPGMTKQILSYVQNQTKTSNEYNIIIGFLESVKELEE